MNARKSMKEFTCLELLDFEEFDSPWIDLFEPLLKQFRRIDSKPTYYKLIGDSKENNILWIENSLSFLKKNKKKSGLSLFPNVYNQCGQMFEF